MFDFLKLDISSVPTDILLANDLLDFKGSHSFTTGEIQESKLVAEYKSCKFIIYPNGRKEFRGSLHKMSNDGIHNFDDFSFDHFLKTVEILRSDFGIDPSKAYLKNVEFGVNVLPPIATEHILKNLLVHRGKSFESKSLFRTSNYKQVCHNRYFIKAYDKQLQYSELGYEERTLRFEIKHVKMCDLNMNEIRTLKDLTKVNNLDFFDHDLMKKFNEIIMYDPTLILRGENRELKHAQWSNPGFWLNLNKQKRYMENRNYQCALENSSDRIQKKLAKVILEKCKDLKMEVTF